MSKSKDTGPVAVIIAIIGLFVLFLAVQHFLAEPEPKPAPVDKPAPIEYRPTPAVIPQPAPTPTPEVKPRDITTEPTADLLAEWNAWRHGPAARTREIQTIYETLLDRGVIRRDGEPAEGDYGGRRKIGRRR